jgi:hypothetical protein
MEEVADFPRSALKVRPIIFTKRTAMNRRKLTSLAADDSLHTRGMPMFVKPGVDIAILAGVQIICFLALTRLEPRFFIIHLYQLLPYVAIVLLIAYGRERWAYMIGPLVSAAWLGLANMAGLLGSAVERLRTLGSSSADASFVAFFALATAVIAVLITVLSRVHWVKEYSGHGRPWRTFLVSLGIVVAYYGVLLHWFWDMIPNT